MHSRRVFIALASLIAGLGILTVILFVQGLVAPGVLAAVIIVCLVGWAARVARNPRPGDPTAFPSDGPRPANAPPDGHLRFTLVVEGLGPDRIAEVWSELCRPDRPPTEELRLLFRTFTVVEGRRFRFRNGDPTATAALLTSVLGAAAGVSVRTHLEPAAERTPPWS
jgi:hypothetical protein